MKEEDCNLPHSPYNIASTPVPSLLSLSLDKTSVKSDNSDFAIVTATVLDSDNAVIQGLGVAFSASGGQISITAAETDANGQASITFSSGTSDKSNQVVTISANVSGLPPKQIPIQVTGSTLTLSTDNTTLPDDGSTTAILTILAKDVGESPVYDTTITLSVSGTGSATLSTYSDKTDIYGELDVTVTGTGPGNITVTASGLGTTKTQDYTVGAVGSVFGISAPATDPASLDVGSNLTVTVDAPGAIANVRFATTLGVWDGGSSSVVTNVVVGGTASAVLSSTLAGLATVQVFDAADSSTSDILTVAISREVTDAAQLTLQANPSVVALSSGGIENTATLIATVRTSASSGSQAVGDVPVAFSIENPTAGGGEKISPVIVFTDSSGTAETTFTSGSMSSGEDGVTINAWVVDEGTTGSQNDIAFNDADPDTITRAAGDFTADGFEAGEQIRVEGSASNNGIYTIDTVAAGTLTLIAGDALWAEAAGATINITAISNSVSIVIGGTAGSVVIGRGSTVTSVSPTTYALPMSVLVADSNGNPVSGAVVSLSVWPTKYSTGVWYDEDPDVPVAFVRYVTGTFDNEDSDGDMYLDAGEDTNRDDELTPPNSAAGELPMTVTTDDHGVANFDLTYLKESSVWITDRVRASTLVLGTETTSSTTFRLPYDLTESKAGGLADSSYPIVLTIAEGLTDTYNFPTFRDSGTDEFTTTTYSNGSTISINLGVFTYNTTTVPADSAGDSFTEYITVQGEVLDPDSAAVSHVFARDMQVNIYVE